MTQSRVTIRLGDDGLSGFLTVTPGPAIDRVTFDSELSAGKIVAGIDSETYERIATALDDPLFACENVLIAVGREACTGKDARVELGFATGIQPGHVRDDGSFDYYERDLLKPVKAGEVLGVLHPAEPGIPGQRVDGASIVASAGRELSLELLSGVTLGPDRQLRAARDGVVLYVAGRSLDVVDHHVHRGAVDLHSGNLRMQGSLEIHGDVKHPFSAVATGDIEIYGNIDAATVRAGGKVRVRGRVRGGEGVAVSAEGDLTVSHAESAELNCGGQLRVQEAINSRLCAVAVHAIGQLRGGQANAESQIVAKEVGAASGIDTRLTVGEPLTLPVVQAQLLIASLKAERMAQRVGGRSSDRGKGGKAGRVRADLGTQQVQRLAERTRRREALLRTASIQVDLAYPGVSIHLGQAQLTLDTPARSTRYRYDEETSSIRAEKATR